MKKNKNSIILFLWIFGVLLLGFFIFLIFIGVGFGEAVVKAKKSIDEAKKEWDSQNVNPIDSIKHSIIELIDSVEQVKGK